MRFSQNLFLGFLIAVLASNWVYAASQADDPAYIGSQQCGLCHQNEYRDWLDSHHDLAMQHASKDTVLGDFDSARFLYNEIETSFYQNDGQFWVRTDGVDGTLQDFRIEFVFGVTPLQQYLVRFDDGRLQALSIAWDSRPEEQGGQRWFHLYPDENITSEDVLHWTRQGQNWNLQCAACHSTNLQKNYSIGSDSYETTWYEIDVACEACHGPGQKHFEWVTQGLSQEQPLKGFGKNLSVTARWLLEKDKATATNQSIHKNSDQIKTCASCHSRRSLIADQEGSDFLDQHIPSLIEPGLYHYDGQILDEVYVYSSFAQSKMYEQGVTCTNCHNPHSLELVAPGNSLCAQCHNAEVFDTPTHHHHSQASAGAQCVNCHMPETTYMVVDPRRDHSIRIPQPQLTEQFDIPNACNQCHRDQGTAWAVENYTNWYGDNLKRDNPVFAFHAAATNPPESTHLLQNIAFDPEQALMTRASAVALLNASPSQNSMNTVVRMLESDDALVRFAALRFFELLPIEQRAEILWPLLDDKVKAVRIEASRLLAGYSSSDPADRNKLDQSVAEYQQSLLINADTAGGMTQLADLYLSLKDYPETEKAYLHALKIEPLYLPARLNLADMYRITRQDQKANQILQDGLQLLPLQPDLNFAVGLMYVRLGQIPTAVKYLGIASEQAPGNARYLYTHAVGLYDTGKQEEAIEKLKAGAIQHPNNQEIISALVSYLQASGLHLEAEEYRQLFN